MCIDYYGRFQAEAAAAAGGPGASGSSPRAARPPSTPIRSPCCVAPRTASSRSRSSSSCCPTRARSCGASGAACRAARSATRCAGCRSSRYLYDHAFDAYRADPEENPYEEARDFVYHRAWTGPLYGALAFVVRVMCVEPEEELQQAYGALAKAGFPPQATALFDDVSAVDYATVGGTAAGGVAGRGSDGGGALVDPAGHRFPRTIPARDRAGAGGKVTVNRRTPAATRWSSAAIVLVGTLLALLLIWPLAEGVRGAFVGSHGELTFAYVATVFRNPIYLEGLRNALAIAVFSTAIAGVFGIGAALLLHRYQFPGRRLLAALVPLPLMVPPFVGAVGMKYLLGRAGALNALLERLGVGDPQRADRLAARGAVRRRRRADRAAPLPDRLLQRAGRAGGPQRRDGRGRPRASAAAACACSARSRCRRFSPACSPPAASCSSGRSPSWACR